MLSLFFSTLTYSLRDFSRATLDRRAREARQRSNTSSPTVEHASDLIFVTAVGRLLSNILILIGVLHLLNDTGTRSGWRSTCWRS